MKYFVGQIVTAVNEITEERGEGWIVVLADPGDMGVVKDINEEGHPTVLFQRTGMVSLCFPEELSYMEMK